jgi:hypothetical protein
MLMGPFRFHHETLSSPHLSSLRREIVISVAVQDEAPSTPAAPIIESSASETS